MLEPVVGGGMGEGQGMGEGEGWSRWDGAGCCLMDLGSFGFWRFVLLLGLGATSIDSAPFFKRKQFSSILDSGYICIVYIGYIYRTLHEFGTRTCPVLALVP